MGQQQLLLIILAIVVIGLAIAGGIQLFTAMNISSNKDGITHDLLGLGRYAYGYKLRPIPLGGGGNCYTGFIIPPRLIGNENATYSADATDNAVTLTAVSKYGYGTISAVLDSNGVLGNYSYDGDFR